ncbi:acyltransferase [Kitasatospora sp. NPDC006697]|uniref:acyltransferase family protein n=1 Tax=Kitasatospora sp. NPDC006697 TaxID=3364020 RepID=UPI0036B7BF81
MSRDRYVDFLRALAIVLVVLGHWLITGLVRDSDGSISAPELLATVPWTQWLTLGFQIMPLFFLAGGYAAAGSLTRNPLPATAWMRSRALRLLLPTAAYAVLVLGAMAVCTAAGVDRGLLGMVGWALGMQFWFLPVFLLLGAATPALHAAHRRWGLLVPAALAAAALLLGRTPLAPADYLLVWGVAYQLGFCWHDGQLTLRRSAALAGAGAAAFALLIGLGPYPVSLVLVTGERLSNTNPPSPAMLAWALTQTGLCVLLAPAMRRVLARERIWRLVRPLGAQSMTLYLWHMVPVLAAAAAFYLTDLAPEPVYGSGGWWLYRLPWLAVLSLLLLPLLAALGPLHRALAGAARALRPEAPLRAPATVLLAAGVAATVPGLVRWAEAGFAQHGSFPLVAAVEFGAGTAAVALAGIVRRTALGGGREQEPVAANYPVGPPSR